MSKAKGGKAVPLDMAQLKARCLAPIDDFEELGTTFSVSLTNKGKKTSSARHIYIDRGADVLAVAHLDTVQNYDHFALVNIGGDNHVLNCQLDDRLGAYIILDFLPQIGINCDVLLTEGEESCSSTAQDFEPPKQYNWMFSFDRAGTDVVTYQFEGDAWNAALKAAGFAIGRGSYSDIAELDHAGCMGVNVGCGYYDNHGKLSHANLSHTVKMINLFARFYATNKAVFFDAADVGDYWANRQPAATWYGKWDDWQPSTPASSYKPIGYVDYLTCDYCHASIAPNSIDEDCLFEHDCCTRCFEKSTGTVYDNRSSW